MTLVSIKHAHKQTYTNAPDLDIDNLVLDLERLERELDADRRVVLLGRRNVVHVALDETRLAWQQKATARNCPAENINAEE